MSFRNVIAAAAFPLLLPAASASTTVDITLNTNPPPITHQLAAYLPTVFPDYPIYGFGQGRGWNQRIAFSFEFLSFQEITSAQLILDLMPTNALYNTDFLLFSDNNSVPWVENYANDSLSQLLLNVRQVLTFDLTRLPGLRQSGSTYDISSLLLDGELNIVYIDDATIFSARLIIVGRLATVPAGSPSWCQIKQFYR